MGKYDPVIRDRLTPEDMAYLVDYSLLRPYYGKHDVERFIGEVKDYHFNTCYVNSVNIEYAAKLLKGCDTILGAALAFPFGSMPPDVKAFEAEYVIKKGAMTVDAVIDIGAAKAGDWDAVARGIAAVATTARKHSVIPKCILETGFLTDDEKVRVCKIAVEEGMEYVKTCTGFAEKDGATEADIRLMKSVVGNDIGVKASGQMKNYDKCLAMLNAGAQRIGAGAGIALIEEARERCKK